MHRTLKAVFTAAVRCPLLPSPPVRLLLARDLALFVRLILVIVAIGVALLESLLAAAKLGVPRTAHDAARPIHGCARTTAAARRRRLVLLVRGAVFMCRAAVPTHVVVVVVLHE